MSPTEYELRAALHSGEGSGLDADTVIARAESFRRQRRARLLTGASVAVLVAGLGVGGAIALHDDGHAPTTASDSSGQFGDAAGGAAVPAPKHATARLTRRTPLPPCPGAVPASIASVNRPERLLPADTVAVTICRFSTRYDPDLVSATSKVTITDGVDALVQSLNDAPAHLPRICPQYRTAITNSYVLSALDSSGRTAPTVLVTINGNPCATTATNGTTTRYEWTPPASIAARLASLH